MCEESAKTWTSSASSTTQSSWPFFVVRTRVVRMRMMLLLPLTPTQRAHTLSHTRPSYSHTHSLSLSSVVLPLLSPVIHLRSSSSFLQLLRLRPSSPSAAFRSPPLVLIPSLAHALVMISCEEHHVDRCCSNAATERHVDRRQQDCCPRGSCCCCTLSFGVSSGGTRRGRETRSRLLTKSNGGEGGFLDSSPCLLSSSTFSPILTISFLFLLCFVLLSPDAGPV